MGFRDAEHVAQIEARPGGNQAHHVKRGVGPEPFDIGEIGRIGAELAGRFGLGNLASFTDLAEPGRKGMQFR